jgi:uncharacterized membrane protein YfcA
VTKPPLDVEGLIGHAAADRRAMNRRRARAALGVSFGVLVVWAAAVTATGQWGRVTDNWVAAVTMVFGSFVAGSTPQGGGAVAFPVFTKLLEVPTEVARSFSLFVQSVGMACASLSIIINRRAVEWRSIAVGALFAAIGFLIGLFALGDPDAPFWPSTLKSAYVKVTFTLIVVAMAFVVWLNYRQQIIERINRVQTYSVRIYAALAVFGLLGGVASSLVGSGADVLVYIVLVILIGIVPRVGVPSSVIIMAFTSLLGLIVLGIVDGQIMIGLNAAGDVTTLGGAEVGVGPSGAAAFGEGLPPLEGSRFDLLGLWLAAAPIVAFGAPLGAYVSSKITDRQLVVFVLALAAAEALSTMLFLEDLRTDPVLAAYAVLGLIAILVTLTTLVRFRRRILGLGNMDMDETFTRTRLDVGPRYREQLEQHMRETEERTRPPGEDGE